MKTSKSLDTSTTFADNNLKNNNICMSLESIFVSPPAMVNDYAANMESSIVEQNDIIHVPGIGPSIPEAQIQKVFEYFEKCAANNGGYVYDFDIENDICPHLDIINN